MAQTTKPTSKPQSELMHLHVEAQRCTGCRVCEVFCSFRHERAVQPSRARLWIQSIGQPGFFGVTVCQQCLDPECVNACAVGALCRDESSGLVRLDTESCVGCEACVSACPFGAMGFDTEKNVAFKCDWCGGNPECAAMCPTHAVEFLPRGNGCAVSCTASGLEEV